MRSRQNRKLVPGEQRCNTCKYIRDLELFEYRNAYECQMCTRKRDRVRLGMVTYGNSRSGGVKSAAQRKKIEQANAEKSLRHARRRFNNVHLPRDTDDDHTEADGTSCAPES